MKMYFAGVVGALFLSVARAVNAETNLALGTIEDIATFVEDDVDHPTDLRADDGVVVWERSPNTGSFNIEAYDFATRELIAVRSTTRSDNSVHLPDVSARKIVWTERDDDTANIRLRDLDTFQITDVTRGSPSKTFPTIHGDTVVWRLNNVSSDVFRATAPEFEPVPVSNDPVAFEGNHDISQERILYAYDDGTERQVRVFELSSSSIIFDAPVRRPGVISPPRARIEGDIAMWQDSAAPRQLHVFNIQSGDKLLTLTEVGEVDVSESLVVYWEFQTDSLFAFDIRSGQTSLLASGIPAITRNGLVLDEDRLTWAEDRGRVTVLRSALIVPDLTTSEADFVRCDPNGDGRSNLADAIWIVSELFRDGEPTACPDAADCNADGLRDLTDAVYAISFQLLDGEQPLPPFPNCGRGEELSVDHCPPGSTSCSGGDE